MHCDGHFHLEQAIRAGWTSSFRALRVRRPAENAPARTHRRGERRKATLGLSASLREHTELRGLLPRVFRDQLPQVELELSAPLPAKPVGAAWRRLVESGQVAGGLLGEVSVLLLHIFIFRRNIRSSVEILFHDFSVTFVSKVKDKKCLITGITCVCLIVLCMNKGSLFIKCRIEIIQSETLKIKCDFR